MIASEDIGRQVLTYGERYALSRLMELRVFFFNIFFGGLSKRVTVISNPSGKSYRKPVEHFLKAVDEITLEDIASISKKIISSPLTLASFGDGNCFLRKK